MSTFLVLAAYQGAAWLDEQLASLRAQTVRDWTLLVRDDGSHDATPAILARAAADPRVRTIEQGTPRLGVRENFHLLLRRAVELGAEYVFCTDQDDIWLPEKIERQLRVMRQTEAALGPQAPVLVHSDLAVVDRNLQPLHASFMSCQRLKPRVESPLRTLLTHNFVAGCTLLANRALLQLALPIPETALGHDWWLALVAAAAGSLAYLDEPTVLYRQHDANQVGASGLWSHLASPARLRRKWQASREHLWGSLGQAQSLAARWDEKAATAPHGTAGHASRRETLERYLAAWGQRRGWRRAWALHRLGIGPPDPLRRLVAAGQLLADGSATKTSRVS